MPPGPLRFDATEVREVLRMIESESLDVRAVTMGVKPGSSQSTLVSIAAGGVAV